MSKFWVEADEDSPLRQGDIIRTMGVASDTQWGVIINADCDIAQRKNREIINFLKIISAEAYTEQYWAPLEIEKMIAKRASTLLDFTNAQLKKSHPSLSALSSASLVTWISEIGYKEVLKRVGADPSNLQRKMRGQFASLEILMGHKKGEPSTATIFEALRNEGKTTNEIQNRLKGEFDVNRGFPDYFFVPELPSQRSAGFVVTLREILAIESSSVFRSPIEARISNLDPAFARVGRFTDRIRYSIAQKLAFLFSRIGLAPDLELDRTTAAEIASERIVKRWEIGT